MLLFEHHWGKQDDVIFLLLTIEYVDFTEKGVTKEEFVLLFGRDD